MCMSMYGAMREGENAESRRGDDIARPPTHTRDSHRTRELQQGLVIRR